MSKVKDYCCDHINGIMCAVTAILTVAVTGEWVYLIKKYDC